jgi:hypothetical protein
MQLTINNNTVRVSAEEAHALRLALTHHLKKIVSSPNMPQKPVVQRLLVAASQRWDAALADVRASGKPGVFAVKVGQFVGEVSRGEMLRLWKCLENDTCEKDGDSISLVDTDFMNSLFETMKDNE